MTAALAAAGFVVAIAVAGSVLYAAVMGWS